MRFKFKKYYLHPMTLNLSCWIIIALPLKSRPSGGYTYRRRIISLKFRTKKNLTVQTRKLHYFFKLFNLERTLCYEQQWDEFQNCVEKLQANFLPSTFHLKQCFVLLLWNYASANSKKNDLVLLNYLGKFRTNFQVIVYYFILHRC